MDLKQKQLRRGTTKAELERFTADVDAGARTLMEAEQGLGECVVNGRDTSAVTQQVQQCEKTLREARAGLACAKDKDAEAQRALKDAERQVSIEAEAAALANLKAVGLKVDQMFADLEQLAKDAAHASNAVRVSGGSYASAMTDARLQFEMFLRLAGHPMTQNGFVSGAFRKFEKWSDAIPDPEFARTRKRDGHR